MNDPVPPEAVPAIALGGAIALGVIVVVVGVVWVAIVIRDLWRH